uniref:Uncharacterized protein n=1 Tax=Arundo donax TaxID=35708 RepID=A0A0A9BSC0_ARUDO
MALLRAPGVCEAEEAKEARARGKQWQAASLAGSDAEASARGLLHYGDLLQVQIHDGLQTASCSTTATSTLSSSMASCLLVHLLLAF